MKSLSGEVLLQQEISPDMKYVHYEDTHSICWNHPNPNSTWSFVFDDKGEEVKFTRTFVSCIYEVNMQDDFDKLKIEDKDYLVSTMDAELDYTRKNQYVTKSDTIIMSVMKNLVLRRRKIRLLNLLLCLSRTRTSSRTLKLQTLIFIADLLLFEVQILVCSSMKKVDQLM